MTKERIIPVQVLNITNCSKLNNLLDIPSPTINPCPTWIWAQPKLNHEKPARVSTQVEFNWSPIFFFMLCLGNPSTCPNSPKLHPYLGVFFEQMKYHIKSWSGQILLTRGGRHSAWQERVDSKANDVAWWIQIMEHKMSDIKHHAVLPRDEKNGTLVSGSSSGDRGEGGIDLGS